MSLDPAREPISVRAPPLQPLSLYRCLTAIDRKTASHRGTHRRADADMTRLESLDPRHAQVVLLRFFGGLNLNEIAAHLKISRSTVESDWRKAWAILSAVLACGSVASATGVRPL